VKKKRIEGGDKNPVEKRFDSKNSINGPEKTGHTIGHDARKMWIKVLPAGPAAWKNWGTRPGTGRKLGIRKPGEREKP